MNEYIFINADTAALARLRHVTRSITSESKPAGFVVDGVNYDYALVNNNPLTINKATEVQSKQVVDNGDGTFAYKYVKRDKTREELVPQSVTRIQIRDVLIDNDLFDAVEGAIAAMPEGTEKKKMQEWWENAPNFRRDNARIAAMAAAMGLNEATVDALFIAASQVE